MDENNCSITDEKSRVSKVKNLARLCSPKYIGFFLDIATKDESTAVRAQAAAALGRMRSKAAIPALVAVLNDSDPKVVCQAVRGLLVFKGDDEIDNALRPLASHENETVQEVIRKAYSGKGQSNVKRDCFPPRDKALAVAMTKKREPYFPVFLRNVAVNADVEDALQCVPDESVHLTFTSPPYYNARDYSIYKSYAQYLDFLERVFRETHRITKEGRFLVVNTSPIIIPRVGRQYASHRYPIPFDLHARIAGMDGGDAWEFIDDIVWEKPEYSVKNRVAGFAQHRKPLAYKSNAVTEYLMVYRKKTERLLDWNMRAYPKDVVEASLVKDGFETTNVWRICPKSDKVHSAVFPEELCKRVIEYYSYKGDLVFDPFGGSGTAGRTARRLGRAYFMTEKDTKYFEYMKSLQGERELTDDAPARFMTLEEFAKEAKG